MPQPITGPLKTHIGPDALLENKELATQIAIIASTWAAIEDEIGQILASLFHHNSRKILITAFYTLNSLPAKISFIRKAAEQRLPEEMYREFNEKILSKLQPLSSQRAKVVHGMWGYSEEHPNSLILYPPIWLVVAGDRVPMKYTAKDFEDIQDRLNKMHGKTIAFSFAVLKHLPDHPKSEQQ